MTQQEILALEKTKTEKIRLLLSIGLTRKQTATALGIGYGFVQNVYKKYYGANTPQAQPATFAFTTFNRNFGVEIEAFIGVGKTLQQLVTLITDKGVSCEMESYGHNTRPHWKIVKDGSLVATGTTFEIVSPILSGIEGLKELEKVCEALAEYGARINKTCGLHIHFDAENFNLQCWKNLLENYHKLEQTIDNFMPLSRRANNNNYCKGLGRDIEEIKSATSVVELTNVTRTRYTKINTQSYARHKTVEFRQHSGTTEFLKIKNWILFLHNLVTISEIKIIATPTLEGLLEFNQEEIVAFYNERTEELSTC